MGGHGEEIINSIPPPTQLLDTCPPGSSASPSPDTPRTRKQSQPSRAGVATPPSMVVVWGFPVKVTWVWLHPPPKVCPAEQWEAEPGLLAFSSPSHTSGPGSFRTGRR